MQWVKHPCFHQAHQRTHQCYLRHLKPKLHVQDHLGQQPAEVFGIIVYCSSKILTFKIKLTVIK